MRKKSIVGVILIIFGLIWIAELTGIIIIDWSETIKTLWPLLFIAIGISLLAGRKKLITTVAWLLTVAVFVGYGIIRGEKRDLRKDKLWFIKAETENYPAEDKILMDSEIQEGKLIIQLGPARINIEDGNNGYLAKLDSNIPNLEQQQTRGRQAVLKYIHQNYEKSNVAGSFDLKINHSIPWEMDTTFSVVDGKLNFRKIPVKKLNLKLGVGDLVLIIGDKQEYTVVDIQAGATELDIYIPENAGIMLKSGKLLSNLSFHNINITNQDGVYISENYETASQKIEMHIQSAVSTIDIFAE